MLIIQLCLMFDMRGWAFFAFRYQKIGILGEVSFLGKKQIILCNTYL